MSTQELDVKKAWRAIRRRPRLVAAVTGAGLLAGVTFGVLNPPMYSAKSLVVLPPPTVNTATGSAEASQSIDTQVFIADSEPVLKSAGQNVNPPLSTKVVRERVDVAAVTADVIEIKARGTTAQQSITLANAVAEVYLVFVTTEQKLPGDLGKKTGARVLEQATTARGGNWIPHLGMYGLLGALVGALAGSIWILAAARGDRRLRLRDEIADAVGIPVLASVAAYRAKDVSDWANLLERYTPSAVDAWSLRKTLRRLGLDVKGGPPVSLAVITFADDDRALPLGPQLAAFATSIGIVTDLVVDTHHESTNALLEGDPAVPGTSEGGPERRLLGGTQSGESFAKVALRIHLIVVDREAPQVAGTLHTTTTLVGLSSGAVTAEELARLAVAAAADDRTIDGLVVADPDPADRTTGRVPQAMRRSSSRLPTLLTGAARRTTK